MTDIEKKVIALYVGSHPLSTIRDASNLSDSEIYRVLKKFKIELKKGLRISPTIEKKVVVMYTSGNYTIKEIIRSTGVKSAITIYRILKRNGVPKRGG